MPLIKVERIVSFTSEDSIHTANNILLTDTTKKWKCKVVGEKNASVVLQLDQPYIISGIDIGNENSAYIEVLVSRSSSPDDYKVLLVMSSFMTPLEARQGQNGNKVRMFTQKDFSELERNEKWDRVMVVCTQPFNRHLQYGLSFINIYTNDKYLDNLNQPLIGKFVVRPESPDNISTGSLFARRKELHESASDQILKGAAAIREATSLAQVSPAIKHKIKHNLLSTPSTKVYDTKDKTSSPKPRNRNELLYSKDEEDEHEEYSKFENTSEKETNAKDDEKKGNQEKKEVKKKKPTCKIEDKDTTAKIDPKTEKYEKNKLENKSNKRKITDKVKQNSKKHKKIVGAKPFTRLLEDVVLVISGIQNPERASLRSMALSMGAKYKADWDNTCTHLICAFANTPKFNQVKGNGKIVKKSWLDECYNKKKRFPWRRYAMDNADKGIESEEEIWEQEDIEQFESPNEGSDTDIEMGEGSDTENQIQQIKKKQKEMSPTVTFQTDTDNEMINDHSHTHLKIDNNFKNIFNDKSFYVDKGFDIRTEKKIKQYIVAYQGTLVDNIQAAQTVIITNKSNYKNIKVLGSNTICISPDWIWECHNCQKIVSMDNYVFD